MVTKVTHITEHNLDSRKRDPQNFKRTLHFVRVCKGGRRFWTLENPHKNRPRTKILNMSCFTVPQNTPTPLLCAAAAIALLLSTQIGRVTRDGCAVVLSLGYITQVQSPRSPQLHACATPIFCAIRIFFFRLRVQLRQAKKRVESKLSSFRK